VEYSAKVVGVMRGAGRAVQETVALVVVGGTYWTRLQPLARRELAQWERRARQIPDSALRRCALAKLSNEGLNPEAAALFAVLSPSPKRRRVTVFIVAFQVLYDYLDAVNEMEGCTDLQIGIQLHRALTDAIAPGGELGAIYPDSVSGGDGGYSRALIGACREALDELPTEATAQIAAAAARCGAAQSHNHAFHGASGDSLVEWSLAEGSAAPGYEWWEVAAGGISCLAVHALAACALRPDGSDRLLASVERAYFPSVCALSALLDSLADYYEDANAENHRFVEHYSGGAHAARRLVVIAEEATTKLAVLPDAARHKVILVGICGYYLSFASVEAGFPAPSREALLEHVGWLRMPMLTAMSLRRRLHSMRSGPHASSPALPAPTSAGRRMPGVLGGRVPAGLQPRSKKPAASPERGPA
jgi:tetraprenyl-beta-curcumene synthase